MFGILSLITLRVGVVGKLNGGETFLHELDAIIVVGSKHVGGTTGIVGAGGPCSQSDAVLICLTEMLLGFRPALAYWGEYDPLEDGHFKEASCLDGDECLINHLLASIWQLGFDGSDITLFQVVNEFLMGLLGFHGLLNFFLLAPFHGCCTGLR